jgi:5-(carboxyamino)imidazole ribonucleotide mutase
MSSTPTTPRVGVIMGSKSDWETMRQAVAILEELGVGVEKRVISAHRAPDALFEYASTAQSRGLLAIIAGAGSAAHLPGVTAAKTLLPVIGVPIYGQSLGGLDALLAILQMPGGIPVGTVPIGANGAINAGILAAEIVAMADEGVGERLRGYREKLPIG